MAASQRAYRSKVVSVYGMLSSTRKQQLRRVLEESQLFSGSERPLHEPPLPAPWGTPRPGPHTSTLGDVARVDHVGGARGPAARACACGAHTRSTAPRTTA